jgi:hypothetical protein
MVTGAPLQNIESIIIQMAITGQIIVGCGNNCNININQIAQQVAAAQTTVSDFFLRDLNAKGEAQAIGDLANLQAVIQTDPNVVERLGQIAQLYQTDNDVSAAQTSDLIADKLAAGTDPAKAVLETSIPEPTNTATGTSTPAVAEGAGVQTPPASPDGTVPPEGGGIEVF